VCPVSPGLASHRCRQRRRAPAAVPITPPNTQNPPQRRLAPCAEPTGAHTCEMRAGMETPYLTPTRESSDLLAPTFSTEYTYLVQVARASDGHDQPAAVVMPHEVSSLCIFRGRSAGLYKPTNSAPWHCSIRTLMRGGGREPIYKPRSSHRRLQAFPRSPPSAVNLHFSCLVLSPSPTGDR